MLFRTVFAIVLFLLLQPEVVAQCPDKDLLMRRLRAEYYLAGLSPKEKVERWLPVLDSLKRCYQEQDSVLAAVNRIIGANYYYQQNYLKALEYYPRYLELIKSNSGKPNIESRELVGGYYHLSQMYRGLNMVAEWQKSLDSSIYYFEKFNYIDRASLVSLYNKIEYYFDIGDYYRCIDYATRCENVAKAYAKSQNLYAEQDSYKYASSSVGWKTMAYLRLDRQDEAYQYVTAKIREAEKDLQKFNLGTFYSYLAEIELSRGNESRAINLFMRALEADSATGFNFGCKQILNTMGKEVYFDRLQDNAKAMQCYKRAFKFVNNNPLQALSDRMENLDLYTGMAQVYVKQKEFDSAFRYFQLAFDQIRTGSNEKNSVKAASAILLQKNTADLVPQKKVQYITNLILEKGTAFQEQFKISGDKRLLMEALEVYRQADQFLEILRNEQNELESKLYWRKDTRRLYENAIEVCFLLQDIGNAFYFFEKSRAVLLHDQLTVQRLAKSQDISKQIQIKKFLIDLQRTMDTTQSNSEAYGDLLKVKIEKSKELENLQQQIRSRDPAYFQNLIDTSLPSVKRVFDKLLKDHTALIEIFSGGKAAFVLGLTIAGNFIRKIDKQALDSNVNSFNLMLFDPVKLNQNFEAFQKTASALHTLVFGSQKIPRGRIIISPDGPNFPYEALMESVPGKSKKYFVEDYAISYAYSARHFFYENVHELDRAGADFFGMAPIRFDGNSILAPLEGSDLSLERLKSIFRNSAILVGSAASRKRFMKDFYRFRVVQLYTHASDSGMFREPVIYFRDSSLLLGDLIYESQPDTRLIVLSACETAGGKFYTGEGVFSFSRGFASLGIPSTITNLWSVDNESTYRLTEIFYQNVKTGMPLDVALQKAKLEFIKTAGMEKQLPYFWAAQILAGESGPVDFQRPLPWAYFIGGAILLLALFLALGIRKRKNHSPVQDKTGKVGSGV